MPHQQLALFPEDATPINELVWFECKNDHVYYLQGGLPIFSHACDDVESFRVIACQLVETGKCTQAQIVRAFGISVISMKRYMKRYRELGISGLMTRVAARKPRVVTPQLARQAGQLLANGLLRHSEQFFRLPRGCYGVVHVFVLLAFMALSRVKTAGRLCIPMNHGLTSRRSDGVCSRKRATIAEDSAGADWGANNCFGAYPLPRAAEAGRSPENCNCTTNCFTIFP